MTTTSTNNRYPGAKPFTSDQRHLFFGREHDTEALSKLIRFEQLTVLHGKSGLGKSSLLNAGVLPKLQKETEYQPINIRFGSWTEGIPDTPLSLSKSFVLGTTPPESLLDRILPHDNSLWYYVKTRQLQKGTQHFLLVFDQFEELFSYPEHQIKAFKKELAELLQTEVPQRFRGMLEILSQGQTDLLSDEEESQLFTPPRVKVVLAIRSDRLHLLDKLSDSLQNILHNNYELGALLENDAKAALVRPAGLKGDFASAPFTYAPASIGKILDFLKDDQEKIESIQLQLLCQSFEEKVKQEGLTTLTPEAIGDLEEVISNFYNDKIAHLPTPEERRAASLLIEEGLVLEEDHMRLNLHEAQIEKLFQVTPLLLQKLVDNHLLRSEPSARGGYTYELSHDTLITPVLEAKGLRKEKESQERLRLEEQRRQEEAALQLSQAREEEKKRTEALRRKEEQAQLAREKKVRKQITWLASLGFLMAFAAIGSTIFAFDQSKKANQLFVEAEYQKNLAIEARDKADKAAAEALLLRQQEEKLKQDALLAKAEEETLRTKAEAAARRERSLRLRFQQEKDRAQSYAQNLEQAQVEIENQRSQKEAVQQQIANVNVQQQKKKEELLSRIKKEGNNPGLLTDLGEAYYRTGEYVQAEATLINAIENQDNPIIPLNTLGNLYADLNQLDKALKQFDEAIRLDSTYSISYNNRGLAYRKQQNYTAAKSDFERAIALDPSFSIAYNNLGLTKIENGEFESSISDFERSIQLNPGIAEAYSNLGLTYYNLNQHEKAINYFDRAIAIQPKLVEPYNNRGMSKLALQQLQQAMDDFTRAIEINPDFSNAFANRGSVKIQMGNPQAALQDLDKAIQLGQESEPTYFNRGFASFMLGLRDQAKKDFQKVLQLHPDFAEAHYYLGTIQYIQNELQQALTHFDRALTLDPRLYFAYLNRADLKAVLGDFQGAQADLGQMSAEALNDPLALAVKAEIYRRMDQLDRAEATLQKAFDLSEDLGYAYAIRAMIQASRGEVEAFYRNMELAISKPNPYPLRRKFQAGHLPVLNQFAQSQRFRQLIDQAPE